MARKKPLPYFNARLIYSVQLQGRDSSAWVKVCWEGREFSDDGARSLARDSIKRQFLELGLTVTDFELERADYTNEYRGDQHPAYRKHHQGWREGDDKRRLTVPEDFSDARNLYEKQEAA